MSNALQGNRACVAIKDLVGTLAIGMWTRADRRLGSVWPFVIVLVSGKQKLKPESYSRSDSYLITDDNWTALAALVLPTSALDDRDTRAYLGTVRFLRHAEARVKAQ